MSSRSARRAFNVIRATLHGWSEDQVPRHAAALAYYTLFSLAPLLIVLTEIVALILGGSGHQNQVRDLIMWYLRPGIGEQGTAAVGNLIDATLSESHRQGVISSIVGWVVFVAAASGLFGALQGSLEAIWHTRHRKRPWWFTILDRMLALSAIAAIAFLLLISLVVNTFVGAVTKEAPSADVALFTYGLSVVTIVILLLVIGTLFAAIFKFLSHARIHWRHALIGGISSAILFVLGQAALSLYLSRIGSLSAFGAAGSIVMLVIWVYYSGQIFLLGAEFTKALSRHASAYGDRSPASH